MRFLEVLNHVPDIIFNSHELSLNIFDLIIFFFCKCITLLNLLGKFISHIFFFLFCEFSKLLVSLNLLLNLFILLLNHINLRVDLIHIIIQGIILLISLDESRHDFLD